MSPFDKVQDSTDEKNETKRAVWAFHEQSVPLKVNYVPQRRTYSKK